MKSWNQIKLNQRQNQLNWISNNRGISRRVTHNAAPLSLIHCSGVGKSNFLKVILRSLFIVIFCILCLLQVIDLVKKYLSFPVEVNVEVEEMKTLHHPGITVCNNNLYAIILQFIDCISFIK